MIAQRIPYLRSIRRRSLMDFFNNLNSEHIALLEEFFHDTIVIAKIDYHIVSNYTLSITEAERELNQFDSDFQNLAISRDESSVYISMWR